jgi:hypothetical protein
MSGAATGVSVDETVEKWLIHRDRLDFGPFHLREVRRQVEAGQVRGEHLIIDMESGQRRKVGDHALLGPLAHAAEQKRETARLAEAEVTRTRQDKRRKTLLAVAGLALAVVGGAATVVVWLTTRSEAPKVVYRERESDLEKLIRELKFGITVQPLQPGTGPRKRGGSRRGGAAVAASGGAGASEFDEPTVLGDLSAEGGDEQLAPQAIDRVMRENIKYLAGCLLDERRRNPATADVELDFLIRGSGQVSALRANGSSSSALAGCMMNRMRGVSFPKFNGPRTRATFSMALR